MSEITLSSGAVMHVTPAPFKDADALMTSIASALKQSPMPSGPNIMEMDISVLKDLVLSVATSQDVKAALWVVMNRSTWNNRRIEPGLFDDPKVGMEARKDYFEMAKVAIQENCAPFFAQALYLWKGLRKTPVAAQG